jgi:uncharacterized protein YaaN involved in tellurite resistance
MQPTATPNREGTSAASPHPSPLATASFAAAHAVAKEVDHAAEHSHGHNTDGFVMPELGTLLGNTAVAKKLSPDRQREAYRQAADLDISDALGQANFGLELQKSASKVTRQFIDEVRGIDLENLTVLASQTNKAMQDLHIGDLKPSIFQRVTASILPKRQAQSVALYLEKHRSLSDIIEATEVAMGEERLKLEEHHQKMTHKIDENQAIYQGLSETIAVAELSYAANKKRVEELKKQLEDDPDAAQARQVNLLDQALTRQARRINTLMASRQETLTALQTMDLQLQGITSQISMIDEQVSFNRQVWDNSILMTATDRRMQDTVQAVQYNREQIEKMIKERGGNIAETLGAIMKEQGEGVVNAAVLEFAAAQLAQTNQAMIVGAKDIREKMATADELIGRMDKLLRETAHNAAAMDSADVEQLQQVLVKGGAAPLKGTSGESGTGTEGQTKE